MGWTWMHSIPLLCRLGAHVVQFGVLANLRPEKGHAVLLDAVVKLVARHPNVRFVIAGEGPMRGAIRAQIERLHLEKTVELVGEVRDVPTFLTSVDGVVLPSITNEGFPNAVMEAMAASLPVVATDSGGTRDLVVEGETGFVVPTRNVEALASKLDLLCRDAELRKKMGEVGRWRIARHFTTQHMARQYEALYEALLAQQGN
jgi:glycosyltransferase involved in cell wall biosynthesis